MKKVLLMILVVFIASCSKSDDSVESIDPLYDKVWFYKDSYFEGNGIKGKADTNYFNIITLRFQNDNRLKVSYNYVDPEVEYLIYSLSGSDLTVSDSFTDFLHLDYQNLEAENYEDEDVVSNPLKFKISYDDEDLTISFSSEGYEVHYYFKGS